MNLTEHKKYAIVVLGLFFIWGGISYYWYACSIKGLCVEPTQQVTESSGMGTGGHVVLQPPTHEPCRGLVFSYVLPGSAANDSDAVKALEYFLYTFEGEDVSIDGVYGNDDVLAVKRFQEKYKSTILTPYGLVRGTGRVQEATLYTINTLYCTSIIKQ